MVLVVFTNLELILTMRIIIMWVYSIQMVVELHVLRLMVDKENIVVTIRTLYLILVQSMGTNKLSFISMMEVKLLFIYEIANIKSKINIGLRNALEYSI